MKMSTFYHRFFVSQVRRLVIPERKKGYSAGGTTVYFDDEAGHLEISGDLTNFYGSGYHRSITRSIDSYLETRPDLKVTFSLDHVDITTAKVLFKLFRTIRTYGLNGKNVEVNWLSSDQKIVKIGRYFEHIHNLKLNF